MYLDDIITVIRKHLPPDRLPSGDSSGLLRLYAMLLRAKGSHVTQSDVHDAWSAWMADREPTHESLVPYEELNEVVQAEDCAFALAIKAAAAELKPNDPPLTPFIEALFPSGPPEAEPGSSQVIDLYKMMVSSSEALVDRRQAVNTFFLTINGALLTAFGLVAQYVGTYRISGFALIVIAIAGGVLCLAWKSLIVSFGQLNRGKFKVINTIERHLPAAIYAAEWEALERGENPDVYRSFTSREIWVPNALLGMHILAVIIAIVVLAWPAPVVTGSSENPATSPPVSQPMTVPDPIQPPPSTAPSNQPAKPTTPTLPPPASSSTSHDSHGVSSIAIRARSAVAR